MKNVIWVNGSSNEDNRIFDSEIEAREWADALYTDFAAYLSEENNVGYATPDEKVINYLLTFLPQWADYNHFEVEVFTEKIKISGEIIYRIWTVNV